MKLIIENTSEIVTINGVVPARVWQGKTESGIAVHCLITRVAVHNTDDCSQFEKELAEQPPPRAEVQAFPLRMVI